MAERWPNRHCHLGCFCILGAVGGVATDVVAVLVFAADVVVGSSWWQVLDLQDQADVVSGTPVLL